MVKSDSSLPPVSAIPVWRSAISVDLSWLIVVPAGLWAIEHYYVAILGAYLDPLAAWGMTGFIGLLVLLSLGFHIFAHLLVARLAKTPLPRKIPLLVFGDTGQVWPVKTSIGQAVLLSLAGPFSNLVLAGVAYLVWNAQVNPYLNISMPFVALFNIWLAVTNLTPVYPLDGGRITHTILVHWFADEKKRTRQFNWLSYGLILATAGWGIFLITQRSRYNFETAGITLLYALILAAGLRVQPAPAADVRSDLPHIATSPLRIFLTGLLILSLFVAPLTLLLTNNGLEAPGVALSVEPMVELPANLRHPHAGTFILTSVIAQSPIPVGAWLIGKITPAIQILPPEPYLPGQPSPQETARQGFQMLDTSETTALVVGLRLAGYPASIQGKGVQVDSVLPESHANGILQPGDVITAFDGKPIQIQSDLTNQLQSKKAGDIVRLKIERDHSPLEVQVKLLPPAELANPPRIGITIETAGFNASLPFPAKIVPQKIVGGPSAGLMFTLTIYNLLQPQDLTGGRKIAGTGTINPDGSVGPIGGVEQKVIAAEAAGAQYFLSPAENYAGALSTAKHLQVVKVATAEQAVAFLRSLPPLPAK